MGSSISLPILIVISCVGGTVALSALILTLITIRRRKRSSFSIAENNHEQGDRRGPYDLRSVSDTGKPSATRPPHSFIRAFSERNLGLRLRDATSEPPRPRNVLQRKRYGGLRSSSLPVFSIVAPQIPSTTLSFHKNSKSMDRGEAYIMSPITAGNVTTATLVSKATLKSYWSPNSFSDTTPTNSMRPQPLFHGHSRSLSGDIPSAQRLGANSNLYEPVPRLQRSEEHPGMKRFLSLQQIGEAPSRAPPALPQGSSPFLRVRPRVARSRSPRSRSMESLISGTSSVLQPAGSPMARRKRSATDAFQPRTLAMIDDEQMPAELPGDPVERRVFSASPGSRAIFQPADRRPPMARQMSDTSSASEPWFARSKSSGVSLGMMTALIPYVDEGSEPVTPDKSRKCRSERKARHPLDPPIILTPSPKRYVPPYLFEDSDSTVEVTRIEEPLPPRATSIREQHEREASRGQRRQPKPFISHLPKSPRPQDRPRPVQAKRIARHRSPLHTGRQSPRHRARGSNGAQVDAEPPSNSSLQQMPPQLTRSGTGVKPPGTDYDPDPVACGDLAAQLRRMDSFCNADDEDDVGYFNLTGGTCTAPTGTAPLAEISANRGAGTTRVELSSDRSSAADASVADSSSPGGAPLYELTTRISGFNPRISLPRQFALQPSRSPSPGPATALSPTPSPPPVVAENRTTLRIADDPWSNSSVVDDPWTAPTGGSGSGRSLGLGLAGRFDIGSKGLSYSPAPSPCPSPPRRNPARRTMMGAMPTADDVGGRHPSEGRTRANTARDIGVIGGERAAAGGARREERDAKRYGRHTIEVRSRSSRHTPQHSAELERERNRWRAERRFSAEERERTQGMGWEGPVAGYGAAGGVLLRDGRRKG